MQVEGKEWPWVLRFHQVNPYPFSLPPTPLSCRLIKLLEVGISQGALSFPWPVSSLQPGSCSPTDPLSGMAFPTLICSESSRCPHSPTGQTAWLYLLLSPSFQLLHPRDEARLACPLPTLLSGDMSAVPQWPSPKVSIEPSGQKIDLEIGVGGHETVHWVGGAHLHLHTVDTRIKSPRRVTAWFSGNSKGPSESSKDGALTVSGKQLFP